MRSLWQCFVAVLVFGTLIATGVSIVRPMSADFGLSVHAIGHGAYVVDGVTPKSSAAQAGIRIGESIRTARSFDSDVRWEEPRVGDRVAIARADGTQAVLSAQPAPAPLGVWIVVVAARIAFLLIAAIVAWRLPHDPAARALATFLACWGAAMRADGGFWGPPVLRIIDLMSNEPLFLIGTGALVLFTCRFPARASHGFRRVLERAIAPVVMLGIVLSATRLTIALTLGAPGLIQPLLTAYVLVMVAMIASAIASLIVSYRESSVEERVRVAWVIRTFAVGFSGIVPMLAFVLAGYDGQWVEYLALTTVLIPVGLAYVILRHRVLDIGFVINRAVVYTIVSVIIVGSFIVFEWIVGEVVQGQSRTSALLQLAAALALGMSTRFIHSRVDTFVDDLFFRERHAAEAAIRRFAQEALMVTDPDELIAKTVDVAQRNAHLTGAAFYVHNNGAFKPTRTTFEPAPDVSENDYAVLAMRTWHRNIDLHDHNTQLPGEVAFPMMVRGQLAGFLVCGDKTSHEALAPDERDALAQLARDSGIALDSLRVNALLRTVQAETP